MSGMTGPDPLKALRQLHLQRADIARQPPLQFSFNAASLFRIQFSCWHLFALVISRYLRASDISLSRHYQIDGDWLAEFTIDHFAAIHFI
jgi:hypothetical protein